MLHKNKYFYFFTGACYLLTPNLSSNNSKNFLKNVPTKKISILKNSYQNIETV